MSYVAAYTVSAYATTSNRTGKPFNPLLGETYECDRTDDFGWRCLSEQVNGYFKNSTFIMYVMIFIDWLIDWFIHEHSSCMFFLCSTFSNLKLTKKILNLDLTKHSRKLNPTILPPLLFIVSHTSLPLPFSKESTVIFKFRVPKQKHATKENLQNIGRLVIWSSPWIW